MPDILHDFPINASTVDVFEAISTSDGLDRWWTSTSNGAPRVGAVYDLGFGPGYDWHGRVTQCEPLKTFELEIFDADDDWNGTRVAFRLIPDEQSTQVRFSHTGWPQNNEHYRISCYCWAMYLRILKRNLEFGEEVPYESRLDV